MTSHESEDGIEDKIVIIPPATPQSKCHICDQTSYNKLCEHIYVHASCWHEKKTMIHCSECGGEYGWISPRHRRSYYRNSRDQFEDSLLFIPSWCSCVFLLLVLCVCGGIVMVVVTQT